MNRIGKTVLIGSLTLFGRSSAVAVEPPPVVVARDGVAAASSWQESSTSFGVGRSRLLHDGATSIAATDPQAEQGPATITADLVIRDGRLVSGPTVLRVKRGDRVVLRVASDADDELHLHGYDLHLPLKAGAIAVLDIRTSRTGRFTYESHRHDIELGALEIYPR